MNEWNKLIANLNSVGKYTEGKDKNAKKSYVYCISAEIKSCHMMSTWRPACKKISQPRVSLSKRTSSQIADQSSPQGGLCQSRADNDLGYLSARLVSRLFLCILAGRGRAGCSYTRNHYGHSMYVSSRYCESTIFVATLQSYVPAHPGSF